MTIVEEMFMVNTGRTLPARLYGRGVLESRHPQRASAVGVLYLHGGVVPLLWPVMFHLSLLPINPVLHSPDS